MSHTEQIEAFSHDLERLIDRYRAEFSLTYAALIGILHLQIYNLCAEAPTEEDGND